MVALKDCPFQYPDICSLSGQKRSSVGVTVVKGDVQILPGAKLVISVLKAPGLVSWWPADRGCGW